MAKTRMGVGAGPEISEFIRRLGFDPSLTRRVIVDIPADDVVKVYVEAYGDVDAFKIDPGTLLVDGQYRVYIAGADGRAIDVTAHEEAAHA